MEIGRRTFAEVIQTDRVNRESKQWRGTLLDYLEKVKEDPTIPKLAHSRMGEFLMSQGVYDITESDDPRVKQLYKDENLKVYNFFKDEFFGIERTIAQISRYFHLASLKGEESRQVLYFRQRIHLAQFPRIPGAGTFKGPCGRGVEQSRGLRTE